VKPKYGDLVHCAKEVVGNSLYRRGQRRQLILPVVTKL
jgi:hypothetical protein